MINRVELKKSAKEFAYSHKKEIWKPTIAIFVTEFIASMVISLLGISEESNLYLLLNLIITLLTMVLQVGGMSYVMSIVDGKEADLKECFLSKFKDGSWWKILLVTLCVGFIVGFGSILFIIPGIYLSLKYGMVQMILADENVSDKKILYSMHKSSDMMNGHKMEYLEFILSFFGWFILSIFTLGILYIWILPYYTVAQYYYFKELKKLAR